MSKTECSEKTILEALKIFSATITDSFDLRKIPKQVWYDPIYYGKEEAARVVALFMSDRRVSDNYQPQEVERIIANQMVRVHVRHEKSLEDAAKALMNVLLNSRPETMNVYMPVHGVAIPEGTKWYLGHFVFMAQDVFDSLPIKAWSPEAVNSIKANTSKSTPIVMVPVCAHDPDKALEKALEEFQWLENAIRFFIDFGVLGVTTYNLAWAENSIVTQSNGILRGRRFQLKGFSGPMPLEKLLDAETINIISELSDPAKVTTEYRQRIRRAVYLGGLAVHETLPSMSFFLEMAALEALFQIEKDKYISPAIGQQILEAICYLIVDAPKRRVAFEELKSYYGKRSAIVHGGTVEIREQDVALLRRYLKDAIVKILTDPELAKIKTSQEMSDRIKDLKFGKIQP